MAHHTVNSLFSNVGGFQELVRKVMIKPLEGGERVYFGMDKETNKELFLGQMNKKYQDLKDYRHQIINMPGLSDEMKSLRSKMAELKEMFANFKKKVMRPAYQILGPKSIDASKTLDGITDLIYSKQVTSREFHKIVAGLVRWQVLDEWERELYPYNFQACFAPFGELPKHAGRPEEDIYANIDKDRLRDTLEALHQEKYRLRVWDGWVAHQERTKHFLLAFMLSLFVSKPSVLCGKMAAFHRFFSEVCGYTFVAVKNLQNWLKAYLDFDADRYRRSQSMPLNEPQKDRDRWLRRFRKYTGIEQLARWMCGRYSFYGIDV